ncbi:MAG: UPF0280 family protein [Bacteroidales bacterium]
MNRDRFRFLACSHLESDLLIGIPHAGFNGDMHQQVLNEMTRIRGVLEAYARENPGFFASMEPLPDPTSDPPNDLPAEAPSVAPEIRTMLRCGKETGTGPMSSVAGLFAEQVGQLLVSLYGLEEVLVENGGDLFMMNQSPLTAVIHAGASPLSDTLGLVIPPGTWGVCTSSGTVGHSFSFGKADAVTVVATEAPLADAWATSLANLVHEPEDIGKVMDRVSEIPEISGCAVILGERIGIRGRFELKPVS